MKALVQLMALSAGTIAAVAIPSCTSTCEEEGTCGDYESDDPATGGGAGSNGTGGNPSGGMGSGGRAGGGMGGTSGTSATGGDGGIGGEGGSGGEGGMGPDPCDPANPVAGCAVDDPMGIFVAPTGDDAGSGTRDAPFRSITKAISEATATGGTIYACNGTFEEHLVVNADGLVIRGGYTCPSATVAGWLYEAGTSALVRPTDPGYALHLDAVDGFVMSDLDLAARDATAPGASSVGIFVVSSTSVRFERTRIVAGRGADGGDGMLSGSNHFSGTQDGGGAMLAAGGGATVCACGDGSMSTGAIGGVGGVTPTAGGLGLPDHGVGGGTPGVAGTAVSACTNGGLGASAPARLDASGAQVIGTISASNGWAPRAGSNGSPGQPGQGGGGGGGAVGVGKGGGGGGACGGCGGSGGPGGMGGGASIGLLVLDSEIVFGGASSIVTRDAGSGGSGASGETGQDAGTGGNRDGQGCLGGNGGKGAAGGAGGGGAGGVSVGILSKGGAVTSEGVTFTIGNEGALGEGGAADNDGVAGVSGETHQL